MVLVSCACKYVHVHVHIVLVSCAPCSPISQDANELIKIALLKYSADKIAKFDFALENSGGSVVQFSKTYPPALDTYSVMGVPLWSVPSSPKAVIQVRIRMYMYIIYTWYMDV